MGTRSTSHEKSADQPLSETLRLRSRGVVTLPKKLREKYGLREGEALRLVDLGGVFAITPMRPMVPELSREIERMREEAGLSTEELLESLRAERRHSYRERYAGAVREFAEEAFEVCSDEEGRWRWRLRTSASDQVLAVSPKGYAQQAGAEKALANFKERAADARFEIVQGEAGTFAWQLLAPGGGEVLAVGGGGAPHASAEHARRAAQRARRIAMGP